MFRKRRGPIPTDAETAAAMLGLAEAFIKDAAEFGERFDWEPSAVDRLDDYCERFLARKPKKYDRHVLTMGMGAYLGELMVRNGFGRWIYVAHESAAAVETPQGLAAAPFNRVAKRLKNGPKDSIAAFYRHGMARRASPGDDVKTPGYNA